MVAHGDSKKVCNIHVHAIQSPMCKLHYLIFYSFFGKGILGELLQDFATINPFDINLILSIIIAKIPQSNDLLEHSG